MKTYTASAAIRDEHRRRADLARVTRVNQGRAGAAPLEVSEVDEPRVTVTPATEPMPPGPGNRRGRRALQRDLRRRAADSIRRGLREGQGR